MLLPKNSEIWEISFCELANIEIFAGINFHKLDKNNYVSIVLNRQKFTQGTQKKKKIQFLKNCSGIKLCTAILRNFLFSNLVNRRESFERFFFAKNDAVFTRY